MDLTNTYLQVKQSNDFSEDYEVLTTRGYTPHGVWIYRDTCTPASFPLAPAETLSYIRISFFGFNCSPGIATPNKALNQLPMGCDGYLTATPKDPDGRDVPMQIHGTEITWSFKKGAGVRQSAAVAGAALQPDGLPGGAGILQDLRDRVGRLRLPGDRGGSLSR